MNKTPVVAFILIIVLAGIVHSDEKKDAWEPLRSLEGAWLGQGDGMSGRSDVTQEFEFVLNGQFLQMRTKSVFEPQEKNPKGEVHEDLAIISHDRGRDTFVMRAFYVEGFVNTYLLTDRSEDGKTLTFETESVENAPPGTKARLVFKRAANGEMEESFFVAFPGKEFGCFSTNTLRKK